MAGTSEWDSWKTPTPKNVAPAPTVGDQAPGHPNLELPTNKPTIIAFLRHCGCPFAEKTFQSLAQRSTEHPDVHFVAVSHSSPEATERWVVSVGGNWNVSMVVDEQRELYANWGLGTSSTWHVLNPASLYSVVRLGQSEGIWNRPTESGSRWQTSGAFAVDGDGVVKWAKVSARASDLPDIKQALLALGETPKPDPEPEVQTSGFL